MLALRGVGAPAQRMSKASRSQPGTNGDVNALEGEGKGYKGKGKGTKEKEKVSKEVVGKEVADPREKPLGRDSINTATKTMQKPGGGELYNYEYNQHGEYWNYDVYHKGYIGNVMVMLERRHGGTKERVFGKRAALTGRAIAKPVKLQNRFEALGGDDDDDNETEDNDDDGDEWKTVKQSKKMNLNKKKRQKRKAAIVKQCEDL